MAASTSIDLNSSGTTDIKCEPPAPWQRIAQKAELLRDSTIPPEWLLIDPVSGDVRNVMKVPYTCGVMTEIELALTDKDATSLLEMLKSGRVSSFDVTLAFCKRAAIAHQLVRIEYSLDIKADRQYRSIA